MIRLGFLGAGNMATAMVSGIVKSDIPVSICAYDLDFKNAGRCRITVCMQSIALKI